MLKYVVLVCTGSDNGQFVSLSSKLVGCILDALCFFPRRFRSYVDVF